MPDSRYFTGTFSFLATRAGRDARPVDPQRVALAWELALAAVVIPIPGASRPASVQDSVQAIDLTLSTDEVARLSAV
ncbi:aldo/keto reductase [Raineyella sp. W15-4]|uniref:aldo/keto reductase n=1 Tax=Raineyella sp. W15-4 TaxID=3081651 RepID=UPI002954D5AC|nr:aldo/keto reductase [Raineyella sp. W15-4]WOQ15904.1 aldo/keto reductase [Raineyella sp. W15-4]